MFILKGGSDSVDTVCMVVSNRAQCGCNGGRRGSLSLGGEPVEDAVVFCT